MPPRGFINVESAIAVIVELTTLRVMSDHVSVFSCGYCAHIDILISDMQEKPFECTVCNKGFGRPQVNCLNREKRFLLIAAQRSFEKACFMPRNT